MRGKSVGVHGLGSAIRPKTCRSRQSIQHRHNSGWPIAFSVRLSHFQVEPLGGACVAFEV
jgi:hypothetical protein